MPHKNIKYLFDTLQKYRYFLQKYRYRVFWYHIISIDINPILILCKININYH